MLKFELFMAEYIFGYALQSFVYILGLYAFSKQKLQPKIFVIASLVVTLATFVARSLPINFGVHTLLIVIVMVLLGVWYLKMPIYPTFRSSLFLVIILLISETLNVFLLKLIFSKVAFDAIMNNQLQKAVAGFPSSVIFAGTVIVLYFILNRKNISKVDNNGSISI